MKNIELKRPTLILDKARCLRNIRFMKEKAERHNMILRPHFKTHQSLAIGDWFRESGTGKITVSSVGMAKYFANAGWKDICIAFPFNLHEINDVRELALNATIHLTVCSSESLEYIKKNSEENFGIYIKTDTGYHRTGLLFSDTGEIDNILRITSKSSKLSFTGFMVHNGHTYRSPDIEGINKIHVESTEKLLKLKARYIGDNPGIIISTGDTPSCSISESFSGVDEIRPGNYVFYDLMQLHLGSCSSSDISVVLAAPVVARHRERNEIVVYGGAVHLSSEHAENNKGMRVYGQVVELGSDGTWSDPVPEVYVTKVSQEHGIIKCTESIFKRIKTGDFLGIIPVHSCLAANLMGSYTALSGEVIDHYSGKIIG